MSAARLAVVGSPAVTHRRVSCPFSRGGSPAVTHRRASCPFCVLINTVLIRPEYATQTMTSRSSVASSLDNLYQKGYIVQAFGFFTLTASY